MFFKTWNKVNINTREGTKEAVAPVIISASRSTDIPAFYGEWFINRLREGYVKWINPFNRQEQYISFSKTRLIVFWTKNLTNFINYLEEIDKKGINYYFTFTINDYEKEGLEPRVPLLEKRIETFKELSKKIGKEKVIWRFDPLILSDKITIDRLLNKIEKVGNELNKFTEKLVISFADIECYKKVKANLKKSNLGEFREFAEKEMEEIAKGLQKLNKNWNLQIASCAEKHNLEKFGIIHNKCIDDELMIKLFKKDMELMSFLGYEEDLFSRNDADTGKRLKDKGQRKECGCIISKDIGMYNTCGHLCVYCYANHSADIVKNNLKKHKKNSETII